MEKHMSKKILITGGAGYVGAVLTPKLINLGHSIKVLDLMMYGESIFDKSDFDKSKLEIIKGDIRDQELLKNSLKDVDVVMHLACISNDPSFDLNPELGKSINLDAFEPLVKISKAAGVKRFIYASSSSVYGVKEVPNVTEDMSLEPLTDYSKFKADCEVILQKYVDDSWTTTTIRPATVCGYSPRQRLDVIVNILTNHAFHNREIKVFGGGQLRPNIHIEDMADAYILLMNASHENVNGKIFNAGFENQTVDQLAEMVKKVVGSDVKIVKTSTDDNRSYHISSQKIQTELGFKPKKSIEDAVVDLNNAFKDGLLPNSMTNENYFNIKVMLHNGLK
jgi:nucleoside-diphosphate-sugar epimerase